MPLPHPHFQEAVSAIDSGNLEHLQALISQHPELISEKANTSEEPYAGYFYNATLLHHVAFNPHRDQQIPANIVEITRFLLDSGADPNAICGGGPKQPNSGHGTVIGLVVSGFPAINNGLAEPLVKVLMAYGAELEYGEAAINLFGALYHTVENKRQKEAARILYDLGHDIDMVLAAGLGLLHSVQGYFLTDHTLKEGADRFFKHHRRDDAKPATDQEVMQDCLLAASINNELEVMEWLLNTQHLDINAFRRWGPWQVTPLHGACWSGWIEASELLINRGADTTIFDPEHNGTPVSWAHYCGRKELFDWLSERDELFGLADSIEFGKFERFKRLFGDQDPDIAMAGGRPGVLLRIAAYGGYLDMVKYLLERGADPTLTNSDGKSALDWAKEREDNEVIDQIMAYLKPS